MPIPIVDSLRLSHEQNMLQYFRTTLDFKESMNELLTKEDMIQQSILEVPSLYSYKSGSENGKIYMI